MYKHVWSPKINIIQCTGCPKKMYLISNDNKIDAIQLRNFADIAKRR